MELPDLADRRVLLVVTGSIAGYKSAELCRLLVRTGAQVQVAMTAAARQFVGEATFAALSGKQVATEMFDAAQEAQIGHIRLADEADVLVAAPATANLLAKMAHGIADDLVSTIYLAFKGPVLIAPAMNVHMWEHAATQDNVALLRKRGHRFVGPDNGEMACGHVGKGRMTSPEAILAAVHACLVEDDLDGCRLLVSAGPTREAIDPVRFLSNRSTGRMGFAIAAEAAARGAQVVLVAGPTALEPPPGVEMIPAKSAAEMASEVTARASDSDVVIMAAAVADYRPVTTRKKKLKKSEAGALLSIDFERTDDILAGLGRDRGHGRPIVLVGFAAETDAALDQLGPEKLRAKGCDLLVANNVLEPDAGFEVSTNRVVIYDAVRGRAALPLMSKRAVAGQLLDRVVTLWRKRSAVSGGLAE